MIGLQNALWYTHAGWLNGLAPEWGTVPSPYWGWNEVPVSRDIADSPKWWDAVMIKLPAGLASVNQLGNTEKLQLEKDLASWETKGKIVPGSDHCASRPGSYMVFVQELAFKEDAYYRKFYCENWQSPQDWYQLVYYPPSSGRNGGACFIDSSNAKSRAAVMV